MIKRKRIFITGQVQGVGFRPAVYQIATKLGLSGFVYNDTKGVTIELQGQEDKIEEFLRRLQTVDKPLMVQIKTCKAINIPINDDDNKFVIQASDSKGVIFSQVTADMAVCGDCLREMQDENDFRYHYPFINCTNCGPRYSIVKNIPYDRPNTTMVEFKMCPKCSHQYKDVNDRRFHAQPVACPQCGPQIFLQNNKGQTTQSGTEEVVTKAAELLLGGKILAIKGIGGFHLAVDALNEDAVIELRKRKKRDHKPFALMAKSVEIIKKYAMVNEISENILKSPISPIVLLPKKPDSRIASGVAEGVNTFGFMLCYAPLHYLLFEKGLEVLVMTSGNISDEPLIYDNQQALQKLVGVADAFLMHNRQIYRRVDDSIVHIINNQPALLRRARGYVPSPIISKQSSQLDIFAGGSDLKNTFCFVKNNQFICSEHIGDLEDAETYHYYVNSIEHLRKLFDVNPSIIACDLHPAYFSTQHALSMPASKTIQIQHHWAHAASVLAEHNLDGPVIGIICDGTGYGTDGAIWGCECLIASLDSFERFGHLSYYFLPGADKAAKEAIRPLMGLLKAGSKKIKTDEFAELLKKIEPDDEKRSVILQQLDKKINCTESSSLGRVFDAVAAMVGLGNYNYFEAQLPMALEAIIDSDISERYDFEFEQTQGMPLQLDINVMLGQILKDIKARTAAGVISAKFHNCIAEALCAMALKAREKTGLNTVAISGGVFCNRYLTNRLIELLNNKGFSVLSHIEVPSNDGGISLGQAVIAAKMVQKDKS